MPRFRNTANAWEQVKAAKRELATKPRCAVPDEFQGVATVMADWSPVADRVELVRLCEHFGTEDAPTEALAEPDIVVTLRERARLHGEAVEDMQAFLAGSPLRGPG